jgi:hypothetical protein
MNIQRRFEPEPEALDRVVEILYRLLAECPEACPDRPVERPDEETQAPCFSITHE